MHSLIKLFDSQLFLGALILTIGVWILRGFGILTFLPGAIIWLGIFGTISIGVISSLQNSKRW